MSIDPEFGSSKNVPDADDGRNTKWLVVAALVGAAILVGLLLRFSAPSPPKDTSAGAIAAPTTGDAAAGPDASSGSAFPVVVPATSGVPLGDVVPGFVDTITTLTWDHEGVDVVRWRAAQPVSETMGSFDHGGGTRNRTLDASGRWFSEVVGDSALTVHSVSQLESRAGRPRVFEGIGGGRPWSAAWHDMRPGRLAWLVCDSAAPDSVGTLHTVDVAARVARPTALRLVDVSCEDEGVWLARWGDWGILLHRTEEFGTTQLLLNPEGALTVERRLDPGSEWFVGVGPKFMTVWTEGLQKRDASSFLLSPDGLVREPVPGLAPGERLESALISPDGSLLALVPDLVANYGSAVRVIRLDTGSVVAEITQPSSWVNGMVWSTDSRFLVYQRWPDVTSNWAGVPRDVELVFFDTDTLAGTALPLPGYAPVLRSAG